MALITASASYAEGRRIISLGPVVQSHSPPGQSSPASSRKTALMQAARRGDTERVRDLLRRGAAVNEANGNGGTALMYAVLGGHSAIVDLLIGHGAQINAQGVNGWGALMIACAKGHVSIVSRLLRAGADVNLPDMYGWTPLMRAIYEKRGDTAAMLIAVDDIELDAVNDHRTTALHIAAIVGDRATARLLLAHGADAGIEDDSGRTAADIAEARGDRALARLLRNKSPSASRSILWVKWSYWVPAPAAPSLQTCWRASWIRNSGT